MSEIETNRPVTLADVAEALGSVLADEATADLAVTGVTHDSRRAGPGTVFGCVPGEVVDGHDFAEAAVANGTVALIVERELPLDIPQLVVADARAALGPASCVVYGNPSDQLQILGITGTSGKTTVTQLLASVLDRASVRAETVGTLSGARTTPEAPELQALLADMVGRHVGAVAMEVSSHALELHRVAGTHFAVAGFTNLGHDHLDFHLDMDSYREAKAKLFRPEFTSRAVINIDDPAGIAIAEQASALGVEVTGYGIADAVDLTIDGPISRFEWQGHEIVLRLAGRHNVLNALLAAEMALAIGLDPADIADGLCAADAPRGRFEFVGVGQDFHVVVDYAHKPEAVTAAITAARQVAGDKQVIIVLGAGGDRDREKRPMMGHAAAAADLVVITSDNPRNEDPDAIIDQIVAGIPASTASPSPIIEVDRRLAIGRAIDLAQTGDVVLIAGKGHETYQEIGDIKESFDDRDVAAAFLLQRGKK